MAAKDKAPLVEPPRTIAELEAELERRTAERDEALARESAIAEVLQIINSSPGDLAPVFDAILEKAHSLGVVASGSLQLYEGGAFRAVAVRGVAAPFAELLRQPLEPPPGSPLSRLISGESIVQITDMSELSKRLPNDPRAQAADAQGFRTVLFVPLRKDGALLGTISAHRREVRPFSEKQIALLQNFGAQAVIAMENARLITETREALEQQTATAEVLQVINSSPGDLAPVFETMLEKAFSLCGATYGSLQVYDGERFRAVAVRGLPEAFGDLLREGFLPDPKHPQSRILRGERFVQIPDMAVIPGSEAAVKLGGMRTALGVPLRKDGALLGQIVAARPEVRPFSEKEIVLLENFAAQAVIAMENARLITETREALDQQTATAEVLGVINSSPGDLAPVFDAMLEKAIRLCGAVQGALWLIDGERARVAAAQGLPADFVELLRERGEPTPPLQRVMRGERIIHYLDTKESALPFVEAAVAADVRTLLWVALVREGAPLGAFAIARREVRAFSDKEIALLQNFAAQAVIAIENARLITETREALEQQTATAEVLGVINSSPGDLAPVFDAILEKAHSLCLAAHGALATYDGEHFRAVALHAMPQRFGDLLCQPFRPYPGGTQERLLKGDRLVHIPDITTREANNPIQQAAIEAGIRTLLMVPLRKEKTLLGYVTAHRREVQPFSNKEIALLENFAAQAVIAMENARLLGELRQRSEEIAGWNRELEARVATQVDELGRVGRLKRFLAPQLAELIVSHGNEKILESHRREIVVAFCDVRGYTAFTETAEPEEVLDFLREYHGALGPLVSQFEGTLDQFSGDGIMVFFNDPVPCPDPAERAVKMALAMRDEAGKLIATWRRDGCELGFGAGIAQGYATLGQIGFSERSGYTAIGTVCNLAARLCAEAKDGQILISSRVARAVEAVVRLEDLGNLELKGLRRPVAAFNVVQSTSSTEARPNLTVVAKGPGV